MKTAIITGASSGLGTEFVKAVVKDRPGIERIIVIARRAERLNALKSELGDKIYPLPLDLTGDDFAEKLSAALNAEKPDIALLINNAGFGKLGDFYDIETRDNALMVRLNCEALTTVTDICLPFMKNGGEIINTCSIASFAPNTRMATYSSTKAYVMSLSRALRIELKPKGINVLACCPGPMDTEFLPLANITKGASHTFDTLPRVNAAEMATKSLAASRRRKAVYTNKLFYKFYRLAAKVLPHSIVMKMAKT
ncbi:MAG: SDR family NAD(P)-dependent oxidoreductase [Clostridia bacterium]|nr:SDR family NAD(P)-dependent oxidoreductase [Clostridia bacterium]